MRQFATALAILEALFQNIEPVDEYLAMKICFLLIDTYLSLKLKEKVVIVISYLEKVISSSNGFNSVSNNNTSYQSLSDSLADKDTFSTAINMTLSATESTQNSSNNTLEANSNSSHDDRKRGYLTEFIKEKIETEEIKYRIHLNKARLYLLSKNVKAAKKEVKAAFSSVSSPSNYQSLYSMFLKAHLEYARANYPKSIKLLIGSASMGSQVEDKQEYTKILYFNNLGCIHFKLKKYNLALHYFTKALRSLDHLYSFDSDSKSKLINLVHFANNKKQEIMYNIGTILLFSGSPDEAFYCFQQSTLLFYKLPIVWLRLAECCISSHLKKLADVSKKQKNQLIQRVRSSDESSLNRIAIPVAVPPLFKGIKLRDESINPVPFSFFDPNSDDSSSPSANNQSNNSSGSTSFEYALKCIKNSLFLLTKDKYNIEANTVINNNNPNSSAPRGKVNEMEGNNESVKAVNLNSDSKLEYLNLKMRAQCLGSYLSLSMNNPVVALSYAKELLTTLSTFSQQIFIPQNNSTLNDANTNGTKEKQLTSSIYLYVYLVCLGNLYAAESLCILNKPNEAINHIQPLLQFVLNPQSNSSPFYTALGTESNVLLQQALSQIFGQPAKDFIFPQTLESQNLKAALCINLAVVHILKVKQCA